MYYLYFHSFRQHTHPHIFLTAWKPSSPLTSSHPSLCNSTQSVFMNSCVSLLCVLLCLCKMCLLASEYSFGSQIWKLLKSHCSLCLNSIMLRGLFITKIIDFPFTFLPCRDNKKLIFQLQLEGTKTPDMDQCSKINNQMTKSTKDERLMRII